MTRLFQEEVFVGDSIERMVQVKQQGAPVDISQQSWTLMIKDHPHQSDDECFYSASLLPYDTGLGDGKGVFAVPYDLTEKMEPRVYWFVVRVTDDSAAIDTRKTVLVEPVRMVVK